MEIKNLNEFIHAAMCEFWNNRPKEYRDFCTLLGMRITDVKQGVIKEDEYTLEWTESGLDKLTAMREGKQP